MNFYKATDDVLINLDLVKKVCKKDNDWYIYFIGEEEGIFITSCIASEIIKIAFSKSEKEKRKISLFCDHCGKPFKLNVIFDENGESNNVISRLCSECLKKKKNGDSTNAK